MAPTWIGRLEIVCGIAGVLRLTGRPSTAEDLAVVERMVDRLRHRGPDSHGVVCSGPWSLGACRLRILDLDSAADQPLRSSDSTYVIAFNGELYNYVELRQELRGKGHAFASSGDTEVVLHAYEEWGTECLSHFNGMFALAVLDTTNGDAFLGRDRFGVKPLYFAIVGDQLVFASEVGAILESQLVDPAPDRHALLDYLTFGITDHGEGTFFASIRQIPPGHFATVERGRLNVHPWYRRANRKDLTLPSGEQDVAHAFLSLLESSLRLRMRSDVPVGVLLSGGLDSSSILSVTAKVLGQRNLKAFSVSFPGSHLDEIDFARTVAEECQVDHEVECAKMLGVDDLLECIRFQGEPVTSPSVLAQWLVMKAAKRHGMRVLLSGQGSDEYLGGYEYFDAFAILSAATHGERGAALRHLLHDRLRSRLPSVLAELGYLILPKEVRSWAWRKPWLRARHALDPGCPYHVRVATVRSLHEALILHMEMRLAELLRYEDRNSMAHSIETRQPFLDYRLVAMALDLPESLIVGGGYRKRVLRLDVEGLVPKAILDRTDKIGFQTPDEWLATPEVFRLYRDRLENPPDELREIFDARRADREFRRMLLRHRKNDFWRVLNLLLWYQEVVDPARARVRQSAPHRAPPLQVIVPSSADWTAPGSGGGMEAFTRAFADACRPGMVDLTVLCAGTGPQRTASVRIYPIARSFPNERRYVRLLRRLVSDGGLPIQPNAVVLANAEHYVLPFRRTSMPIVLVSHGVIPETLRQRKGRPYVRLFRQMVEGPAVRRANRIVVINRESEEYYRSTYPDLPKDKIIRIPVGINLRDFDGRPRGSPIEHFQLRPDLPIILFVGRLSPEKNVRLVIETCDLLRRSSAPFQLVVVGDGSDASFLELSSTTRPWLKWIRHASHDQVLDLMAIAKALAICSSYESGPLVLLEAIASGLPVVSTPVGRVRELVTSELGRISDPDPSSFAQALLDVMKWDRNKLREQTANLHPGIDFEQTFVALSSVLREAATRGG